MGLVITISGLHGTGKSTYAKAISQEYGLRCVSAGEIFRKIAEDKGVSLLELNHMTCKSDCIDQIVDDAIKSEARKGSVVLDGLLTGWKAKDNADLRIYLRASDETRMVRIARREGAAYEDVERATLQRERMEKKRFKRFYNIDVDDLSIYDLVLNTGLLPVGPNIELLSKFVREYLKNIGKD